MNNIIRKKVSLHAKILAAIIFVGLALYAVSPVLQLPPFLYCLFPVYIWGKIAITDGTPFAVIASICLLMIFPLILFRLGHVYSKKEQYGLRIWYSFFSMLLAYTWYISITIHITALSIPKTDIPTPSGMTPVDYNVIDLIMSRAAKIPAVHSTQFVLFMIVMLLYTAECIWMHILLTRAKEPVGAKVEEIGS